MADDKKKNDGLKWIAGSVALVVGIFALALTFHRGPTTPAPQAVKPMTSAGTQPGQNGIQMGGISQGSFGPLYQRRVANEIGQNFKKIEAKQHAKMMALQQMQNNQAQKTDAILNSIQQQQQQLQQEITTQNRRRNE
jgi:conjugal transfer pilus assembly protein TraB